MSVVRSPFAQRASRGGHPPDGPRGPRCRRRVRGQRLRVGRTVADGRPVTDELLNDPAHAARHRQGPVPGRRRGRRGRRVARSRDGRRRGGRRGLRPAARRHSRRGSNGARSADRPRRLRHERGLHVEPDQRQGRRGLRERAGGACGERYRIQRQIANATEPRAVLVEPNAASGHFTMWSSTQIPHVLRTAMALATGILESKLHRRASRRRWAGSKLQVYPGGGAAARGRAEAPTADQMGRDAFRGLPRDPSGTRPGPVHGDRRRGGRQDPRVPRQHPREHGAYRDHRAGHARPWVVPVLRRLHGRGLPREHHGCTRTPRRSTRDAGSGRSPRTHRAGVSTPWRVAWGRMSSRSGG